MNIKEIKANGITMYQIEIDGFKQFISKDIATIIQTQAKEIEQLKNKVRELEEDEHDRIVKFCKWLNSEYDTNLVAVDGFAEEFLNNLNQQP